VTRVACLAVALVVAVPLAGCGGSDDASAPATAAAPDGSALVLVPPR
jgi:hypothetical protein